ncbi:MAG TPA: VIT family protein [Noviherbaspirillum sp.]|uniref:VIT1/CCC1 transporter family protein n=1 Tax=Noviherbaspirillum sp. TaxID=1926288 RepID=UPI002B46A7E8|nr:VIT family protein [Noviherbaspirillum sp.]HJV85228.1 VIT family protein [Noviherbaspirillum sp.]
MIHRHREQHKLGSVGWLRAAVLGANDGIVSTSSLILGVAASQATQQSILVAGVASLVAGAMSMATGEYISVQSQADAEQAALATERLELGANPKGEHQELTGIYVARGLDVALARQVATQLMKHDALSAHARDELGITEAFTARPVQAAFASALSFSAGALLPLAVAALSPQSYLIAAVAVASLFFLALLGGLAAKTGGADVMKGVLRVTFWSVLAMGVTAAIGTLFGTTA